MGIPIWLKVISGVDTAQKVGGAELKMEFVRGRIYGKAPVTRVSMLKSKIFEDRLGYPANSMHRSLHM